MPTILVGGCRCLSVCSMLSDLAGDDFSIQYGKHWKRCWQKVWVFTSLDLVEPWQSKDHFFSSGGAVPTAGSWLYFVDFVPGFLCQICAPPSTGERWSGDPIHICILLQVIWRRSSPQQSSKQSKIWVPWSNADVISVVWNISLIWPTTRNNTMTWLITDYNWIYHISLIAGWLIIYLNMCNW